MVCRTPKLVLAFVLITFGFAKAAVAQEGKSAAFYCTEEASGGLQYVKALKKWVGIAFPADRKFVLKLKFMRSYVRKKESDFDNDETISVYEVTITNSGDNFARQCKSSRSEKEVFVGKFNTIFCDSSLTEYKINLDRNRFLATYAVGYAVGSQDDEQSDTPTISGGTCTKIE